MRLLCITKTPLHLQGCFSGRASETRTHDLFVPNEARYQLRHSPNWCADGSKTARFSQARLRADFDLLTGFRYTFAFCVCRNHYFGM